MEWIDQTIFAWFFVGIAIAAVIAMAAWTIYDRVRVHRLERELRRQREIREANCRLAESALQRAREAGL